jgi:hypothetical protein
LQTESVFSNQKHVTYFNQLLDPVQLYDSHRSYVSPRVRWKTNKRKANIVVAEDAEMVAVVAEPFVF